VAIAEGATVGPVEFAAFQIRPELVAGGTVKVMNAAGVVVDRKPVPSVGKRGGMARGGDAFAVKTAERTIVASTLSPVGIYPFDARVKQYGSRQGLWVFTSIPCVAGREAVTTVELSIEPPEPPPVVGTIRIAPDVAATIIATAANPTAREKLAADELADYLARITGKRLRRTETIDEEVKPGAIAVGRLAVAAGLIAQKELDAVERDGYVVRVAGGRVGICGWRDVGTVYGAYALLKHLGCKFYAPGCEVVPKTRDLLIPECRFQAKPVYEFRKVTQNLKLGHTPSDDLGNPREIGEPGGLVHAAA